MTEQRKNPMSDLYKLIAKLTQPHDVIVDDREGNFLGSRKEEALLTKLRYARIASTSGRAGGSLAKDRSPLNIAAVDLYDRIVGEIREWYGHETDYSDRRIFTLPEADLRQWFLRYSNRWRSQQVTDEYAWERVKTVTGWITTIRDLLDPPFRFPLTAPCPICGQEWAEMRSADDPNETERVRVLNVVERENVEESYVICRNAECGRIWLGLMAARSLRIALDDAALARETA